MPSSLRVLVLLYERVVKRPFQKDWRLVACPVRLLGITEETAYLMSSPIASISNHAIHDAKRRITAVKPPLIPATEDVQAHFNPRPLCSSASSSPSTSTSIVPGLTVAPLYSRQRLKGSPSRTVDAYLFAVKVVLQDDLVRLVEFASKGCLCERPG